MAESEDVLTWLKQRLRAEQVVMREQHRRLYDFIEAQHTQVLAEMERKLCHGSAEHSSTYAKQLALDPPRKINDKQSAKTVDNDHAVSQRSSSTANNLHRADLIQASSTTNPFSLRSLTKIVSNPERYKSPEIKKLAGGSFLIETKPFVKRVVDNPAFEGVCGLAIIMNTIILAFEIEYKGYDAGAEVGYKDYQPSEKTWPGARLLFEVLDIIFVSGFTIELLFRVVAAGREINFISIPYYPHALWALQVSDSRSNTSLQKRFVCHGWIWFDFFIIAVSWVGISPSTVTADTVEPTVMRVARLARMLRAFKMIRAISMFDSLYVLLRSIQASIGALFWSFALLIFVQVACGLCLSQLLQSFIMDDTKPDESRRKVFLYYGTFSRTMITMFEISLVNWSVSCRVLMDDVSEWYGLFYIIYVCCFIFAVIRVIQAVFIAETNRVVAADDQIAIRRKEHDKKIFLEKLHIMFEELDTSGDGLLTFDELQNLCDDRLLKTLMSTLGVTVHDIESLFKLLDNGEGEIEIENFTKGLSRCKGMAQGLDVVILLKMTKVLDEKVDCVLEAFGHQKFVSSWKTKKLMHNSSREVETAESDAASAGLRANVDVEGASDGLGALAGDVDDLASEGTPHSDGFMVFSADPASDAENAADHCITTTSTPTKKGHGVWL